MKIILKGEKVFIYYEEERIVVDKGTEKRVTIIFKPENEGKKIVALEVKDLKKSFKKRTVVNSVSLNISKGEIVGLLGPNGAGKSTSFYMIVGLFKTRKRLYHIRW